MTVLVTGGAGFIGSNFLFYYLEAHPSCRVVCLDSLTYAANLATLRPLLELERFRFVRGDIRSRETVFSLFEEERPELVVNFAAESHVDRSIASPELFTQTNVLGTVTLLEACRAFGVQRFHQVSTDEVYGELPPERPELLFTERSPLCPSSPYSSSKAGADLAVLAWARTYGLPVTLSRCSNNYGPYQFPEKLIPLMILRCLEGKTLPVYGTGLQIRDWLHVSDHCRALDLILEHGREGAVYNIGARSERSNLEVVRSICRQLDVPESRIEHVPDRKGHDRRYGIDASLLCRELGWQPETDFEEGLRQTVQWYLSQRAWWEPILSGAYRAENERLAACV